MKFLTDEDLVARIQRKDHAAFEYFMEQNMKEVQNICLRYLWHSRDAVSDITQKVFFKVYEKINGFKGQSALSSWLYRITVNECLMYLRSQKRQTFLSEFRAEESLMNGMDSSPFVLLRQGRLGRDLERAISRLDIREKTVFILREVEGLTNEETARAVGITVAATKSRLHRSKLKLRNTNFLRQYVGD